MMTEGVDEDAVTVLIDVHIEKMKQVNAMKET